MTEDGRDNALWAEQCSLDWYNIEGPKVTSIPLSFWDLILICIYRVFHLKNFDSTLCLGDFLWHSEAVFGVKSSNRVGGLTFRQEN